jgi:pentatricopeptide repeat protein
MKEVGIQPNDYSYNSVISACEKGRQPDIALSLLAQMKVECIRPNDYSYNSAITACEKGGAKYTDTALALFHEMKKARINPNDVTYRAITQACFDSKRYPEALELAREASGLSLKERPLRINVSSENGQLKWDLARLSEATACMLLTDALLSFVASSKGGKTPSYQDIIVVTGKELMAGPKNPTASALKVKVPAFLNDIAGLETTAIEGNEGRFLITAASLEEWVASGAFEKFKGLFG